MSRERVVQGCGFVIDTACRKSRNLGFWLFFWSLLEQRPKVTRARRHGISPTGGQRRPPLQRFDDTFPNVVRGDVGIAPYGDGKERQCY